MWFEVGICLYCMYLCIDDEYLSGILRVRVMSAADLKAKQGEREPHDGELEAKIPVSSSMCRFWLSGLLSGEKRGEGKERMGWEGRGWEGRQHQTCIQSTHTHTHCRVSTHS